MSRRPIRLRVSLSVAEAQTLLRAAEYVARFVDVECIVHPRIGQRQAAKRAALALEEAIADAVADKNAPLFPEGRD